MPTTQVLYSCADCKLHRVPVQVPAREDEDVAVWMNMLRDYLVADHDARRPTCHPETFTEVLIPTVGTNKVGGVMLS